MVILVKTGFWVSPLDALSDIWTRFMFSKKSQYLILTDVRQDQRQLVFDQKVRV